MPGDDLQNAGGACGIIGGDQCGGQSFLPPSCGVQINCSNFPRVQQIVDQLLFGKSKPATQCDAANQKLIDIGKLMQKAGSSSQMGAMLAAPIEAFNLEDGLGEAGGLASAETYAVAGRIKSAGSAIEAYGRGGPLPAALSLGEDKFFDSFGDLVGRLPPSLRSGAKQKMKEFAGNLAGDLVSDFYNASSLKIKACQNEGQ